MKKTRLKDLPKEKRWCHFWYYYGLHVFLGVFLGSFTLYTFYICVLKPKADLSIMILSDRFELSCETAMREQLHSLPELDVNGDGTVRAILSYVQFDSTEEDLQLDTRMELLTLLSAGDIYIFLANENAHQWLSEQNILGTWGYITGKDDSEIFSIPVSELLFFQGEDFDALQHLTMYIATMPEDTHEYQAQMAALWQLLNKE